MSHDPDAHSVGVRFRGAPLTECAAPHGLSCATTILANQEPRRAVLNGRLIASGLVWETLGWRKRLFRM